MPLLVTEQAARKRRIRKHPPDRPAARPLPRAETGGLGHPVGMATWQLVLAGLVILTGLIGVPVPGVPGPSLIWAAVLWWALAEQTTPGWLFTLSATALLLLARFH